MYCGKEYGRIVYAEEACDRVAASQADTVNRAGMLLLTGLAADGITKLGSIHLWSGILSVREASVPAGVSLF